MYFSCGGELMMKKFDGKRAKQRVEGEAVDMMGSPVQHMLIAMMEHDGVEALRMFGHADYHNHAVPA
jgi:hypothetical protein